MRPTQVPHRGPRERPTPRNIVIEKLHFDTEQIASYDSLISAHSKKINALDRELGDLKRELYETLTGPENIALQDSFLQNISATQQRIEHIHYAHFQDIRSLCRPSQIEDYQLFTEEIVRIFSRTPPRKPPVP